MATRRAQSEGKDQRQDANGGSAPLSGPSSGPSPERLEADRASALRAEKDAALIETIRTGPTPAMRQAAMQELLTAHEERIFAICMRMVRDYEAARDLTQDAMVKVIQGLDSFDARARFSTWLTRVTMNVAISYMRKRKLRRHASLDAPLGGAGAGDGGRGASFSDLLESSGEPGAHGRVEADEEQAMLLRAIDMLDAEHRSVLVLRDGQDLDYQQIAEVLGVPLGTVKSRLFRARAALREAVESLSGNTPAGDDGEQNGNEQPGA